MRARKFYQERALKHLVSMPFVWSVLVPLIFLDIVVEVYHHVCFSLYGLEIVDRKKYIKIDRHKLKYLSFLEKISCAYCGYANGLAGYTSEIGARTEEYWCGIKHQKDANFIEPEHHREFVEYDDEEGFNKKYSN